VGQGHAGTEAKADTKPTDVDDLTAVKQGIVGIQGREEFRSAIDERRRIHGGVFSECCASDANG
jgi:hypothetical protein